MIYFIAILVKISEDDGKCIVRVIIFIRKTEETGNREGKKVQNGIKRTKNK